MNLEFFKRITANSNEYAVQNLLETGTLAGYRWCRITLAEIVKFCGVILKMSINDRKLGDYEAYFQDNIEVHLGPTYTALVEDFSGWASKIQDLFAPQIQANSRRAPPQSRRLSDR